jgi:hypothetical protein
MAAGLGFKDFVTGEVLTAADVDGYLMQGIWVFATATARDAAVTSPQEGNFAFTKDNNSLWYYDGAAWVASGATGDIEGVTAGIGISGGGTSGTVTVTNSMATAIDAKGDLVAGTGADTFAKLTVGANNTVLTADSAEATGLKWATPSSGGGMTLINTGGTALSGGSVTISSIPGTYKHLQIIVRSPSSSGADVSTNLRFNGDTGSNYNFLTPTLSENAAVNTYSMCQVSWVNDSASSSGLVTVDILDYANTTTKKVIITAGIENYQGGGSNLNASRLQSIWNSNAAINEITVLPSGGNTWSTGTVFVYGVS